MEKQLLSGAPDVFGKGAQKAEDAEQAVSELPGNHTCTIADQTTQRDIVVKLENPDRVEPCTSPVRLISKAPSEQSAINSAPSLAQDTATSGGADRGLSILSMSVRPDLSAYSLDSERVNQLTAYMAFKPLSYFFRILLFG